MIKKLLLFTIIPLAAILILHAIFSYRRYNVILITIDTLRPEYLSCYKPRGNPTPNIDKIAENGVLFTNAFTLIPITMPSHTSMLTSRSPYKVKVFNNGDRFERQVPMITDLLKPKGYKTGAFISLGVLNRGFGLEPGFDTYEDNFDHTNGRFYKVASEVNADAIPWIEQHRKKPFFAWIHYSDPHEPYVTVNAAPDTEILVNGAPYLKISLAKKEKIPIDFLARPGMNSIEFRALAGQGKRPIAQSSRFLDPRISLSPSQGTEIRYSEDWLTITLKNKTQVRYFQNRAFIHLIHEGPAPKQMQVRLSGGVWETNIKEIRKNYAAEVRYTDQSIGELWNKLSELDLLDNTIVIVTSDHGEGLKTHGILGHVDKLWDEIVRIPFIVYYPGGLSFKGKKEDQLINLLDIMPTILDLLHVRNEKTMEGHSLKYYLSWSPIDRLLTRKANRSWTFASTFAPEAAVNSFAVTNGQLKLIQTPAKGTWEAYDLIADPMERKNLARWNPKRYESLASLRTLLDAHRREAEFAHQDRESPDLDENQREMLHALGYVANGENENGGENGGD